MAALLGACGGGVPDCGDSETVETALSIVDDTLAEEVGLDIEASGLQFTMANIVTVAHDDKVDKYTCQGQMTAAGPEGGSVTAPFTFTSQALEGSGKFWVEIQDVSEWVATAATRGKVTTGRVPDCGDSEIVDRVQTALDSSLGMIAGLREWEPDADNPSQGYTFTIGDIVMVEHDERANRYACQVSLTLEYPSLRGKGERDGGEKSVTAPLSFLLKPPVLGKFEIELDDVQLWAARNAR